LKNFNDLFKPKSNKSIEEITEEEILTLIKNAKDIGALRNSQALMVQNVFELDDKTVKDIMVHRSDLCAIDGNALFSEVVDTFIEGSFSRYPVYIGSIDNIIGIVHIKDILYYAKQNDSNNKKIRDLTGLIRPAESVPETHGVYTLFTTMKLDKTHMAIVVDEYGQTSGIVTMENILEEIVGNIQDEHDHEESLVITIKPGLYRMEGKTPVDDVEETLGIKVPFPDIETLNGYIINLIGEIPKEGANFKVIDQGYEFHVLNVKNRVVQAVRIKLLNR
jgi:putative hemolysin